MTTKYHYQTNNEKKVATKEYNNIDENKRSMTKNKLNAEEYNLVVLQEPQVVVPVQQQQLLIHDPNPGMDLIVYEPNPNAPDPEEDRIAKSKPKKEKKKKKHGEKKTTKKHSDRDKNCMQYIRVRQRWFSVFAVNVRRTNLRTL